MLPLLAPNTFLSSLEGNIPFGGTADNLKSSSHHTIFSLICSSATVGLRFVDKTLVSNHVVKKTQADGRLKNLQWGLFKH